MAPTPSFSLITLFSLLSLVSSASQYYIFPNHHFINCGSNSDINFTGKKIIGDVKPTFFSVSGDTSAVEINNNSEPIYQTARILNKKSWYELEADGTNTFVMVRLHFSPMSSKKSIKFDVLILGFSLLSNFSVAGNLTVIREFIIPIGSKRGFRIEFTPSDRSSSAFVNAIEAFTTPPDLFIHLVKLPHLSPAGKNGDFENLATDYAFNPVHRINVGGQKIDVEQDTLRRIWVPDDSFISNSKKPAKNRSFDGRIVYEDGGATVFDAPDLVYRTAKQLDVDSNNISWNFDVKKNSTYLVRSHFCNIISSGVFDSSYAFDFIIYSHHKPIKWGEKRLEAAFFDDFVVDSDGSGIVNISISRIPDKDQIAFLNGIEIIELLKNSGPNQWGRNGKSKDYKIVFIITGSCVAFMLILLVGFFIRFKYAKRKPKSSITIKHNLKLSLKIPLSDILRATDNFNDSLMIGSGGFGKVYKGILENGKKVAVKRGEKGHGQGQPEFVTEILVLSKIQHRHLVSLIGYCDENSEMILVYEFMEKGTLQDHLYNDNGNHPKLSWTKRLEICINAAEGLHYLHTGSNDGIIHRDVKSTNILIDKDYVAKVADFGMSRSDNVDPTESSFIKGSFGYMDPEYFSYLKLTKKSDVYSFGVVLLEVLCAKPAIVIAGKDSVNLAEWAIKHINDGNVEDIIDPFLAGTINANSLRKFIETVEGSLKVTGDERPSMDNVKWNLKYALNFQQTALDREPHEDSTMNSSLNIPISMIHRLPSYGIDDFEGNDDSGSSNLSGNKALFSSLEISEAR